MLFCDLAQHAPCMTAFCCVDDACCMCVVRTSAGLLCHAVATPQSPGMYVAGMKTLNHVLSVHQSTMIGCLPEAVLCKCCSGFGVAVSASITLGCFFFDVLRICQLLWLLLFCFAPVKFAASVLMHGECACSWCEGKFGSCNNGWLG